MSEAPLPHHAPGKAYLSPTVIKTLHVPLREVKFTKGGARSPSDIPLPLPLLHTHTHTRMRQTPDTPLSGSQVYREGYICYHPVHDSGLILEQGQVCKEPVVLRRWEI